MTDLAEPAVLVRASGSLGHLTLNRPRAINALDLDMVRRLRATLDLWESDPGIGAVLLDGAGERGFCAGGDVRGLAERVTSGRSEDSALFFREEYALDARIAEYPKTIVALADGITMGGGIGLAGHAAVRVVTERSRLAMPETRIGFTPDVGGTWLLGRAPGRLGEYLGLTGAAMDAADALYAGFADHLVPSASIDELRGALRSAAGTGQDAGEAVRALSVSPQSGIVPPSSLERARVWIDDAFAADTVTAIIARLRARAEPEASTTADLLGELSPTGLAVTLASVRRSRGLPGLRAALEQEYGLVMWFATSQPDLPEGIRAQVIDKDRAPRWQPATLDELPPDTAESALSYRPHTPLWD